jgi:hypothetical protein
MATALAATGPPLVAGDVKRAADKLHVYTSPAQVLGTLLECGTDILRGRGIVEALRALRDAG